MRLFYRITAWSMALGVIHTALTPLFYSRLDEDALWFASTGLALVFLGMLNLAAERVWQPWLIMLCIPANLVMFVFGALVVAVMPEVQAWLFLVFVFCLALASILALFSVRSGLNQAA